MPAFKGPGYVIPSSAVASELERLSPQYYETYQQAMAQPAIAAQQQIEEQEYDFTKALTEAYKSSFQTMSDISASNLGQGYKERYLSEEADAFQSAYEAAQQGYQSKVGNIVGSAVEQQIGTAQNYAENVQQYTENLNKYTQSAYDYLSELYESSPELFEEGGQFARYTVPEVDEQGQDLGGRLMTLPELTEAYGKYEDGTVGLDTPQMQELFQLLETQQYDGMRFGDYVYEKDPDLYNWLQSSSFGTNISNKQLYWKEVLGTEYTGVYDKAKTFGGMTQEEVEKDVEAFSNEINNFVNKLDPKKDVSDEDAAELATMIENFAKNYDVTPEDLGLSSWDELRDMKQEVKDVWNETGAAIAGTAGGIGGGLAGLGVGTAGGLTATAIAAAAGAPLGPVGIMIGAIIGTLIGAGTGAAIASSVGGKIGVSNEELINLYSTLTDQITDIVKTKSEAKQGLSAEDVFANNINLLDKTTDVKERNKLIKTTVDDLYRLRNSMDADKFAQYSSIVLRNINSAIVDEEGVKIAHANYSKSQAKRPDKATTEILSKIASFAGKQNTYGVIFNNKLYTIRDGYWYEETDVKPASSFIKTYLK